MDSLNTITGEVTTLPMQSQSIGKLAEALAKAQGKIEGASKDSTNPHFKSRYADLASVWEACRTHLSANGLSIIQTLDNGLNGVTIITTLAHSSGEWIKGALTLKPVKDDPQGVGSAITYARRYALAAMVGVAPEDDDAEAATGRTTTGTKTAAPTPPATVEKWRDNAETLKLAIDKAETVEAVNELLGVEREVIAEIAKHSLSAAEFLIDRAKKRAAALASAPAKAA